MKRDETYATIMLVFGLVAVCVAAIVVRLGQ
jgi:hypothetical protein